MDGEAFGGPGIAPTWSSSDKDFVTTALGNARLWATVGHGIINEIYWPSTGRPQYRDIGFYLVGDGRWIDLKRVSRYGLAKPRSYVPLLTIVHEGDDYRLSIEVLPDPLRDALLLRYALNGPYRLAIVAAPHLGANGNDNSAFVEDGRLFAAIPGQATCIAADVPMGDLSVGFVGSSDGWQDLSRHGRFTYAFSRAEHGNVAMSATLTHPHGTLAVAFGPVPVSARTLAVSALAEGCETIRAGFVQRWEQWGSRLALPAPEPELAAAAETSATVLKTHEDRMYPGAIVASMSTPWGNHGNTLGGYHLVWPRDAAMAASPCSPPTRSIRRGRSSPT